jgi:hypothetical protein
MSSSGLTGRLSIPETAVLEPRRLWDTGWPACAGHDIGGRDSAFSRRTSPELCEEPCPSDKSEGAGNAGRTMHPQPCTQKKQNAHKGRQGTETSGIPCAVVLRLLRDLPGVPGLLAPVAGKSLCRLVPSVGGTGPHGLTVRSSLARLARRPAATAACPAFVAIMIRPS